jgi:putative SOS response-associated peptidase YedK
LCGHSSVRFTEHIATHACWKCDITIITPAIDTSATFRRCRVFPDYPAPVVRNAGAGRELTMMRWGMPPPPRAGGYPVTNIRNTSSPHWRGWLKPENRCLVPFNSFAEYAPEPNPHTKKKDAVWFALDDDRPLAAFAGIWTEFKGDRGPSPYPAPGLWLPDDHAERDCRAHPPQGDAGDPYQRGARCVDARALG